MILKAATVFFAGNCGVLTEVLQSRYADVNASKVFRGYGTNGASA